MDSRVNSNATNLLISCNGNHRPARAGRGLFAVRPGGDERAEDEDDAARPNPVDERVQEDAECGRVGTRRLPVDQDDVEVLGDGRSGRGDGHRLAGALV